DDAGDAEVLAALDVVDAAAEPGADLERQVLAASIAPSLLHERQHPGQRVVLLGADLDPPVAEAPSPPQRGRRAAADLDGDALLLHRLGIERHGIELVVLAVVLDRLVGP